MQRNGSLLLPVLTIGLLAVEATAAGQALPVQGPGELSQPVIRGIAFRGGRTRGTLVVSMLVDRDGRASDVEILAGIDTRTDSRVVRGLRGARHEPARLDGAAVDYLSTFAFRLDFGAEPTPPTDLAANNYKPVGLLVDRHPALDARRIELAELTDLGGSGRAWVLAGVRVDRQGNVAAVRLLQGVDPDLDDAILEELRSFRYDPASLGEEPIEWTLTVRYPVAWRF